MQSRRAKGTMFPMPLSKAHNQRESFRRARDLHLYIKRSVSGDTETAEKAAGEEGQPLERFSEEAGDQTQVPAKATSLAGRRLKWLLFAGHRVAMTEFGQRSANGEEWHESTMERGAHVLGDSSLLLRK